MNQESEVIVASEASQETDTVDSGEPLSPAEQEDVLAVLCLDPECALKIREMVDLSLYSSFVYRDFATRIYSFIDEHKVPPGEGHLPGLVEDVLSGEDTEKAELYKQTIHDLLKLGESIIPEVVMAGLGKFMLKQRLTTTANRMYEECQAGRPEVAMAEMLKALEEINHDTPSKGVDLAELMQREMKDISFIVDEIIPKGLLLVVGRPKTRKSFSVLHVCEALLCGGQVFGRYPVLEKGAVLYLAMEDNDQRIHDRGRTISVAFRRLRVEYKAEIFYSWTRGDVAGLRRWLDEHPDAKLIVIDTLARWRRSSVKGENSYLADYAALSELQKLAMERDITIAVVHHSRKSAADDILDEISGTTGLAGAADAIWIFKVKRGENTGELFVTGRDIKNESWLNLRWDSLSTSWQVVKDEEAAIRNLTPQRRKILELLNGGKTLRQLMVASKQKYGIVWHHAEELVKDGLAEKQDDGKYISKAKLG